MKPDSVTAVQEERQRVKEKGEGEVESTSSANSDMPVEKILEAELAVEPKSESYLDTQKDPVTNICQVWKNRVYFAVEIWMIKNKSKGVFNLIVRKANELHLFETEVMQSVSKIRTLYRGEIQLSNHLRTVLRLVYT